HRDRFLCNNLVEAYGRCGDLDSATAVFLTIQDRNVFSWTIMIVASVQNGDGVLALRLLREMDCEGVAPDEMTFSSILGALSGKRDLRQGREIHARLRSGGHESNLVVATALINMYSSCGSIAEAREVFSRTNSRDVVSMSSMVAALAGSGHGGEAILLFRRMDLEGIASNEITFVAALVACCDCPGSLALGKQIHERIIAGGLGSNVFLANSLVTMYGRSGEVAVAEAVFRSIRRRSLTSWNSMLAAYTQNGHSSVALDVHVRMDHEGVASDEFTFVTLLDACAMAGTLQLGRQIHDRTAAMGLMANGFVATALLDMYGKRGSLGEARAVFDRHCTGSVVAWTAMVASYAQHGRSAEALELYGCMALEGLAPNSVTFVNILSACSYYGMVDQGWEFFASMRGDHGICPEAVHFGCMVDVLSRAGQLDRAEELLESLPPFLTAQLSLLGACQLHGDLQRG
ncbi:hypothetical protein SELMODRAFT_21174, partial [Selaginella moellendorffii]